MSPPPNDDDRTVLPGKSMPGTVPASSSPTGAAASEGDGERLPVGMRLAEFEVTGYVGVGGFSIVYLAWDHSLERRVALKEYMPSSLAARNGATQVNARSERYRETFDAGLKSFINEGKLLAQFDHPSLVKVYRFWEANGTAYMVMPFYEGVTLKDTVRQLAQPPDEAWLRKMLDPLTAALTVIHQAQCYHRDIAPDNVMLLAGSGEPLLLDFGAARRVIGDRTQALTVILKPGYAPVEQYAEVPGMKQGPWTDVYALAAVVYWCVTGKTPPTSVGRLLQDSYVPLAQCADGRYDAQFLAAVDRALVVLPDHRTRTIERLRDELGLGRPSAQAEDKTVAWVDPEATVIRPSRSSPAVARTTALPAGAAVQDRGADRTTSAARESEVPRPPRRSWRALAVAGTVLTLFVVGAVWWQLRVPATTVAGGETQPKIKEPAVAGKPPEPQQQQPPPPSPQPTVVPPSAAAALDQLLAARDPALTLTATAAAARGNVMRVQITSSEPGYAYVVGLRRDRNELVVVAPAPGATGGRLEARSAFDVPTAATMGVAAYHVVWARAPRNLSAANWSVRDRVWVRDFGAGGASDASGLALGAAQCAPAGSSCDGGFGMAEIGSAPEAPAPVPKPEAKVEPKEQRPAVAPKEPRTTAATPEPKAAPKRDARTTAECQEILTRISLGSTSQKDLERLKALNCGS